MEEQQVLHRRRDLIRKAMGAHQGSDVCLQKEETTGGDGSQEMGQSTGETRAEPVGIGGGVRRYVFSPLMGLKI